MMVVRTLDEVLTLLPQLVQLLALQFDQYGAGLALAGGERLPQVRQAEAVACPVQFPDICLLQVREEVPQRERVDLQTCAGDVDAMIESIRRIAERRPQNAAELDRLGRLLDTLKTQLLCVSPVAQRDSPRPVQPLSVDEIQRQLGHLQEEVNRLADSGGEQLEVRLAELRRSVEAANASLRRRQDDVTL